jgi:predicted nucleotidyltransferase
MKKKNLVSEPDAISYSPYIEGLGKTSELILKRLKAGGTASKIKDSLPYSNQGEVNTTSLLNLKAILTGVKKKLQKLYKNNLVKIILYGSYARGDFNENSDIDLLVVLMRIESAGKEIDKIVDAIYDINLKYNTLISVVPISNEDYKNINSPLLLNVRKDGVIIE